MRRPMRAARLDQPAVYHHDSIEISIMLKV
jgi:hypothetical protein